MATPSAARPCFSQRFGNRRRRSVISLTPLIDVVFILLLFFMLASSFADTHAIGLDAPVTGGSRNSMAGALLVNIRVTGIRVAGRRLTLSQMIARARRLRADNPALKVLVKPGRGVDLQQTVRVLDALDDAGVANLQLMGRAGVAS